MGDVREHPTILVTVAILAQGTTSAPMRIAGPFFGSNPSVGLFRLFWTPKTTALDSLRPQNRDREDEVLWDEVGTRRTRCPADEKRGFTRDFAGKAAIQMSSLSPFYFGQDRLEREDI